MSLEPGTKLGPYEVTAPIGAGGMGEVYRARDTKLNRDVALKVLPEAFVDDAERLARFQREAEVLASLNHPNIAQIYGLEDSGEVSALVLELVEGPTLADRIARGSLPLNEALDIASQLTEALEAAHALGVIHRDLKPANIKITHEGVVKVLDFGLAKAFATGDNPDAESSLSPTLTKGTALGVILGTAAYMSPEQAKGNAVDTRTDVWAFGAVLYEMLAGERAFKGEDVSDTLVSVFRDDPDWTKLSDEIPTRIVHAMRVCLNKDAKERVRDIGAVRLAMQGAFETTGAAAVEAGDSSARGPIVAWGLAASVLAAAIGALAAWNLKPQEPRPVVRFAHVLPDEQSFSSNGSGRPVIAIAPDGSRLAYSADGRIYLREMEGSEARVVSGTEGGAIHPFFSHDGGWIGFWLRGELRKVAVSGGASMQLADDVALPTGVDWSDDDWIVWADGLSLWRLAGSGGTPENVLANASVFGPQMLSDGNVLLSIADPSDLASAQIVVHSLATGESKELVRGARPYYVPTGHLVFEQDGALWGVGFDSETLELTGSPVAMIDGIDGGGSGGGAPQFDVSQNGTLIYLTGLDSVHSARSLGIVSGNGDVELVDVPAAEYLSPRLSPEGNRLVVQSMDGERRAGTLWVYELDADRAMRQLTLEGDNQRPVWSPDGRRVAFGSDRDGTMSIYWQAADGSDVAERLTTAEEGVSHFPSSWSPDGNTLVYMVKRGANLQTGWEVWTLSIEDESTEPLYQRTDAVYVAPELSPDGRWLAYTSGARAGSQDVYVEPFPPTGARQRISQNGGYWPTWSPAGDALIYRPVSGSREIVLNRVDITTSPEFGFTNERAVPVEDFVVIGFYRDYDFTPDGESLLMVFPADRSTPEPRARQQIHIVLNWDEELKARVPTQ